MKLTVELPEDLVQEIKLRAVRENSKLKNLVAELLRRGLASEEPAVGQRVSLPLIHGGHATIPGDEATPERIHEILLQQEIDAFLEASSINDRGFLDT